MQRAVLSRTLDVAILGLTVLYGIVLALSEIFPTGIDLVFLGRLDLGFTVAFLAAFATQLLITADRGTWVRRNWIDIVVILVVALPLLRVLRLARFLPFVRAVRLARLVAVLGEALRAHLRVYGRGNVHNILVVGVVLIVVGTVLEHLTESGATEANIKTFGDALWWAIATITTVGYGDRYPVTWAGRVVAAGLMVFGIALFGLMTASISSWFVAEAQESDLLRLEKEIAALRHEIAGLARRFDGLSHTTGSAEASRVSADRDI